MSVSTTNAETKRKSYNQESVQSGMIYQLIRVLIVCLVSLAVLAKLYQFVTHPPVGSSILDGRWFSVAAVVLEFFLIALWVSCLCPRKTRIFTICCFSVFAIVSLTKGISGEASCGCFGEIVIPPLIVFLIDVLIVGALVLTNPPQQNLNELQRKRSISVASIILLGGLGTTVGLLSLSSIARLAANGDISGAGRVVVFDPAEWKGKKLPILQHIETPVNLKIGSRVLLMIHHNCPDCRKALDEFLEKSKENEQKESIHYAVIEVSPYSDELRFMMRDHKGNCTFGRLSDSQTWFVQTPIYLVIENGILVDYHQ